MSARPTGAGGVRAADGSPAAAPAGTTVGDVRLALHAPPLLTPFNAAGVLTAADVHVAARLGRLAGETDQRVLLAVALAVRAVRAGSVCVRLDDLGAFAIPETEDTPAPASAAGPDPVGDTAATATATATASPTAAAAAGVLPWPEPGGWAAAVAASPLVAAGVDGPVDRPVRWVGERLYLDRYWRDELLVRRAVDGRLAGSVPGTPPGTPSGTAPRTPSQASPFASASTAPATPPGAPSPIPPGAVAADRLSAVVHRLFPAAGDDRQRLAAATAVLSRLTVLTGGPGTGKTTTVARVLAVLQEVAGPGLRIALAAPTGKAAARLQEAVRDAVASFADADRERVGAPEATTVHRLLGWQPGTSTRFRHGAHHHLPHDVVVVDETSMVSLPLMARLLEALRPEARLVLVGDPDQLASVEAGAVLGDLVGRPPVAAAVPSVEPFVPGDLTGQEREQLRNGVVRLTIVHRQDHGSAILPLAAAVRAGDADRALAVLRAGDPSVTFTAVGERLTEEEVAPVRADAEAAGAALVAAARAGDAAGALEALSAHRLMLAHRRGPAGVARWAALVEEWVSAAAGPDPRPASAPQAGTPWYPGRPLLVTANDRETGLYNGDTGVLVADGDGGVVAVFGDPADPLRVRPHRLPPVETVHAMTVHRGQGSQFRKVSIILPPATSPLLTRELLYTAVTRAREAVHVVGTAEAVRVAVGRPVRRASGLREPLT
ncbi:exodeoxyribonuclease V subunit alpha [Georgenia sp. TF02-10]|uniref:exodeoxyribonuclease V subunit alpha n=1 Tax=Georgenia sp. TF02-10 TaxID=2917725 RepID=UPI001FA72D2B|nr:exodeoxyribonuclease V subunit alpha [Georgenia sp. TF02-10]UNX55080.1 exodeoxyribonuclease V subunit alpha [Georgenia sp. TF02-10]